MSVPDVPFGRCSVTSKELSVCSSMEIESSLVGSAFHETRSSMIIVTGSTDTTIRLWDLTQGGVGLRDHTLHGHSDTVR